MSDFEVTKSGTYRKRAVEPAKQYKVACQKMLGGDWLMISERGEINIKFIPTDEIKAQIGESYQFVAMVEVDKQAILIKKIVSKG